MATAHAQFPEIMKLSIGFRNIHTRCSLALTKYTGLLNKHSHDCRNSVDSDLPGVILNEAMQIVVFSCSLIKPL